MRDKQKSTRKEGPRPAEPAECRRRRDQGYLDEAIERWDDEGGQVKGEKAHAVPGVRHERQDGKARRGT